MTTSASTPLSLDLPPMEAAAVEGLPSGPGWQFEPKYDGFRCLAHRHGSRVHLQSKNQKPLERYFPEVTQGIEEIAEDDFVLDGELVIAGGSFETLPLRTRLDTPARLPLAALPEGIGRPPVAPDQPSAVNLLRRLDVSSATSIRSSRSRRSWSRAKPIPNSRPSSAVESDCVTPVCRMSSTAIL